jgi:hypothetical protein
VTCHISLPTGKPSSATNANWTTPTSAWPRTRWGIDNVDPQQRFRITKEVIADPHRPCVLVHTRLEADPEVLAKLRLFALLAPHLYVDGRGNTGNVVQTNWGEGADGA